MQAWKVALMNDDSADLVSTVPVTGTKRKAVSIPFEPTSHRNECEAVRIGYQCRRSGNTKQVRNWCLGQSKFLSSYTQYRLHLTQSPRYLKLRVDQLKVCGEGTPHDFRN